MHKHISSVFARQAFSAIEKNVKKGLVFAGDWSTTHTVAAMVLDNIFPKAEVHENAFDVWLVVSGKGKFILGGEMENQESIGPGEWVAQSIKDGEIFSVGPGDIIDIPPGVPHQIDATKERLETIIVKINTKNPVSKYV